MSFKKRKWDQLMMLKNIFEMNCQENELETTKNNNRNWAVQYALKYLYNENKKDVYLLPLIHIKRPHQVTMKIDYETDKIHYFTLWQQKDSYFLIYINSNFLFQSTTILSGVNNIVYKCEDINFIKRKTRPV